MWLNHFLSLKLFEQFPFCQQINFKSINLSITHKAFPPLINSLKMRDCYIKLHTNNFRNTHISCHFLMYHVLSCQVTSVLFPLPGTSSFYLWGHLQTLEFSFNTCDMFFHTSKSLYIPYLLPRMPFLYFSRWQSFTILSRINLHATSTWRPS